MPRQIFLQPGVVPLPVVASETICHTQSSSKQTCVHCVVLVCCTRVFVVEHFCVCLTGVVRVSGLTTLVKSSFESQHDGQHTSITSLCCVCRELSSLKVSNLLDVLSAEHATRSVDHTAVGIYSVSAISIDTAVSYHRSSSMGIAGWSLRLIALSDRVIFTPSG